MLEEPKIKKVDKRDKQLPQNFEQLIEMYDVEKIWPYMKKVIDYINKEYEDTGWVDISPYLNRSIFSVREGFSPMLRRIGKTVYLRGEVYISTKPSENTNIMFSNLPTQFVPKYQATGAGITFLNYRYYSIWVEGDTIRCDIANNDVQEHVCGMDLCNISPYIVN